MNERANHAHDFRIVADPGGETVLECPLIGDHLLNFPILNKGTAFTERERDELELRGLLPPHVTTLEQQVARVLANYRHKVTDLERYIHLVSLLDRNETLFYRVLLENLEEMLPIVYTPTVGRACREFGRLYRRPRGIYLTPEDRGRVATLLRHWPFRRIQVIVVTDGERILGLGDLGASGMGIPIGKLSLYVAAGGIHPAEVLPVCLDTGTDRDELLNDPLYLGKRRRRVRGEAYDALLEEFVTSAQEVFPGVLIQFEDFAQANAWRLLERYRDRVRCFNDDIQGTGAVGLAALLASERVTGRKLREEKIVIAGAGSAGTGIARCVIAALRDEGCPESQATANLWLADSKGLVVRSRPLLDPHKRPFARDDSTASLEEVIRRVRPTILVGVTGQAGLFSEALLSNLDARPLVLPLSNPTENSECAPDLVRRVTGGRGIVATGSPFPQTTQCNNVYIFPGVGLGAIAAGVAKVTDRMFLAAARTLASMAGEADLKQGRLFPPMHEIRRVSCEVASAVVREAGGAGRIVQWQPVYLPYRRAAVVGA
ncbi:MAG TPA: NAD-dependent malic enzyme [Planctomycetota bacterium]|nr:NAD-dependent malic enzyme [Planctomycetota bacterium]